MSRVDLTVQLKFFQAGSYSTVHVCHGDLFFSLKPSAWLNQDITVTMYLSNKPMLMVYHHCFLKEYSPQHQDQVII